jgi:hypothetical protein
MSAFIRIAVITITLALLAGCVLVGGRQSIQKPTRGEELIDLKAAYDAGALTDEEYQCQRAEILRN